MPAPFIPCSQRQLEGCSRRKLLADGALESALYLVGASFGIKHIAFGLSNPYIALSVQPSLQHIKGFQLNSLVYILATKTSARLCPEYREPHISSSKLLCSPMQHCSWKEHSILTTLCKQKGDGQHQSSSKSTKPTQTNKKIKI